MSGNKARVSSQDSVSYEIDDEAVVSYIIFQEIPLTGKAIQIRSLFSLIIHFVDVSIFSILGFFCP